MARGDKIDPATIGPDTKLRLAKAAELAFPDGSIKASALRAEARRGNLTIWTVANKQFTTIRAIEEMIERCRDTQRDLGSTLPTALAWRQATPAFHMVHSRRKK